ncbi:MAG: hypothetical protein AAF560_08830 [Acidobacteriota bacterium]
MNGATDSTSITVGLENWEMRVIRAALREYGGGSAASVRRLSGHDRSTRDSPWGTVDSAVKEGANELTLSEGEWRLVYDSINATIYALGPNELETVTGYNLLEMLQANLTIASSVWGAYDAKWADHYRIERV